MVYTVWSRSPKMESKRCLVLRLRMPWLVMYVLLCNSIVLGIGSNDSVQYVDVLLIRTEWRVLTNAVHSCLQLGVNIPQRQGLRRASRKLEPKEDYLEKKSSEGKWAKRYFELEQGKLHYYGSKGHDYRQTINMRGIPVHLLENDRRIIEIESGNRKYHLKAKNTAVASDWLQALRNHSLS